MTEIWKDIEGFEGAYQISNLGNLKSLARLVKNGCGVRRVSERILTPVIGTCGYYQYPLKQGEKHKTILIHIEVAKAFIDNPYSYSDVNHKDENRLNNNVNNLEWCTRQYNNTYLDRKQREIETLRNTHPSRKGVKQYTKNGELIKEYQSLQEAERETKVKIEYFAKELPNINVITVPKSVKKADFVNPNGAILVDDFTSNLDYWASKGGISVKFSESEKNSDYPVIADLLELIKLYTKEKTKVKE